MIKLSKKEFEKFLEIMDDYGEYLFGSEKDIKRQLECCLNMQGYWSGTDIRVYYNKDAKDFSIEYRY